MSTDDNHWRAHMKRTARNICTCAVYATSFYFGLPTYFVSHYTNVVTVGHYMLCSIEKFVLKKIRAELLTVMSKVTHLLVCIVLTLCFVMIVQLALVHLKI